MPATRPASFRFGLPAAIALLGIVTAFQRAGRAAADPPEPDGDPFPIEICIVQLGPLTDKANVVDLAGREVRVCCAQCAEDLRKDPEKWAQAVDERIKDEQREFYPLDTCVVDGAKLADAAAPLDVVFRNRLFRLCNDDCRKKLEEAPAKYFALTNRAAVTKQKAAYPLTTCVVTGKPLGKAAVDHVVGSQLVRLADAAQVPEFDKNPGEYLAKVRAAWRKKPAKP